MAVTGEYLLIFCDLSQGPVREESHFAKSSCHTPMQDSQGSSIETCDPLASAAAFDLMMATPEAPKCMMLLATMEPQCLLEQRPAASLNLILPHCWWQAMMDEDCRDSQRLSVVSKLLMTSKMRVRNS